MDNTLRYDDERTKLSLIKNKVHNYKKIQQRIQSESRLRFIKRERETIESLAKKL